jgi:hypothetical protein
MNHAVIIRYKKKWNKSWKKIGSNEGAVMVTRTIANVTNA